jgi:hypothetical protein
VNRLRNLGFGSLSEPSVSPPGTMVAAAGVALAAALSLLALEQELPAAIRLTPRPSG